VNENYQRVDAATVYPARLKFDIPSDARYIHKVLLSWKLGNYRADVSGGSESEGHDHTGHVGAGGAFGGGNVTDGGAFTPDVQDAGVHTPTEVGTGAHSHDTDLEVSWVKTHRSGYLPDSRTVSLVSNHTHTNPSTTSASATHDHPVPSTDGPDDVADAVTDIFYGSNCDVGNCVDWADAGSFAEGTHWHLNTGKDTGSVAAWHDHTQGITGGGGGHEHTLSTHAVPFLYMLDFTLGVAASNTEADHTHTINIVPDHGHTGLAEPAHNDHLTPAEPAHSDHVIATEPGGDVDLTLGIVEVAGGTIMELIVNGETVASDYNGDQSDIVITGYTNTGSNIIELQPASGQNHKGSAFQIGTAKVFIEARKF